MASLPMNRTRLNAAIANQQPSVIAASQANREAHIEAADTLDLLYQYVSGIQANPNGVYAADAGTTDAYAITLAPVPASYFAGMVARFKANTVNTGVATLNVNGLGAKTIKKNTIDDLSDNDILAGQIVEVMYDGTNFQLMSRSSIAHLPLTGGTVVSLTISSGLLGLKSGVIVRTDIGSPEGSIAAPIGSIFLRTDGGASTTLYVKQSGTGNTGWIGK